MTVPEYLRTRFDTHTTAPYAVYLKVTDEDVAMLREIAERWEKMEVALQDASLGIEWPHNKWCDVLAAARAPLGEKTDQD